MKQGWQNVKIQLKLGDEYIILFLCILKHFLKKKLNLNWGGWPYYIKQYCEDV